MSPSEDWPINLTFGAHAFYSQVDGHSEVMNRFLRNLLRGLEGEHPRKSEFVISQDAKSPFEVVHDRNLIHVIVPLPFSNQVRVSMKVDAQRRILEFQKGAYNFSSWCL